ncbi:MAG: ATP-binding cassette domain-containing protein [Phenylobacterium sp.]
MNRRSATPWRETAAFAAAFARFAGPRGIAAAALAAAGATVAGIGLVLVVPILALVADPGHGGPASRFVAGMFERLAIHSSLGRLSIMMAALAGLMVLRVAVLWTRDSALTDLQIGFAEAQRARIARALAAAPWDRVAGLRHARVTQLVGQDILRIGQTAAMLIQAAVAVMMLLMQTAVAFLLAPRLAVLALPMLALSGLALGGLLRRAHALGGQVMQANLTLTEAAGRFMGGLKLAASHNLGTAFVARFTEDLGEVRQRQAAFLRQQSFARLALVSLAFAVAATAALVGFGVLHTPAPVLVALILILTRMGGPAAQVQQAIQQLGYSVPAYAEVAALAADLAQPADAAAAPAEAPSVADWAGPITFHDVTYWHPNREAAETRSLGGVGGVTLTMDPGEMIGLTGPSGAGKSTLADLLVGLMAPQAGEIRIGGTRLDGSVARAWRERTAYVAQDPYLFHDTVRANLAWSRPDAPEATLWAALEAAGAAGLVRRLENGLDTLVGERGVLLSGGERQRLALARGVLRGGRLLVLDEATSAIDVTGEREILQRLRALSPAPTILIIAHRAESLALCDRVLTLDGGRLSPSASQ